MQLHLDFLLSMVAKENLDMQLMDVVTAYLYGSLDNDINMKIPKRYKMLEIYNSTSQIMYSIKLQRSLYGLKQSGCMWYNHPSEYFLKEGFENNPIFPCIFIKKSKFGFVIVAVYVDDLNFVGTPEELTKTANCLKSKFCLGLQIEHLPNEILIHQSKYTEKVMKHFYMNKTHPLSTPMVGQSFNVKKYHFQPQEDDEDTLGPKVPYLSAIGVLMYLANYTRPNTAFAVNLLAMYSSAPT